MPKIRFLGLDVHADTIAVAVAEPDREVRCIGVFPHRLEFDPQVCDGQSAESLL